MSILYLAIHFFLGSILDQGTKSDMIFKFIIILQLDLIILISIIGLK